jgi:2'-5' RNA ligase
MFFAIATLLDNNTWQGILDQMPEDRELIASHRKKGDVVHFSWIVSNGVELDKVNVKLQAMADSKQIVSTVNGGIGIFPGEDPVATLILVRNQKLNQYQSEIWRTCAKYMVNVNPNYSPDSWIPHVTLIHQGIDNDDFCKFLEDTRHKEIRFRIKVDNLAIIYRDGNESGLVSRYDFTKKEN